MNGPLIVWAATMALMSGQAMANPAYQQALAELERNALHYVQASHYTPADTEALTGEHYYAAGNFPVSAGGRLSVSLPDADLDPITRSLLLVESNEAPLAHVRYRVTYSMDVSADFPEAEHHYIEVTRYNLGPTRRNDLLASVPEGQLAGPEEFGVGPHVSWRFVMAPVMGARAALMHASRQEIPDTAAAVADCLGELCLSLVDPTGSDTGWKPIAAPESGAPVYAAMNEWGVSRPARVIQEIWSAIASDGMDALPYTPEQPHFEFVISLNTGGQEAAVSGMARQAMVMDAAVSEIWTQRFEMAQIPPEFSQLLVSRRQAMRAPPQSQ